MEVFLKAPASSDLLVCYITQIPPASSPPHLEIGHEREGRQKAPLEEDGAGNESGQKRRGSIKLIAYSRALV